MNKTRLIWGTICLALAALIAVLSFVLPPDSMIFYAGEANLRWVPALVLGILGVVLLATARGGEKATTPAAQPEIVKDPQKADLNKRLETMAWGLFLIMLGGFAFVPRETAPKGLWSIGIGVIMLGLNAARYFYKIRMSGFTTVLGIIALLGGIAELLGFTSLEGALLLIILGAYLILKPWFDKRQLFGKAEES